jgi:hypothetical protein
MTRVVARLSNRELQLAGTAGYPFFAQDDSTFIHEQLFGASVFGAGKAVDNFEIGPLLFAFAWKNPARFNKEVVSKANFIKVFNQDKPLDSAGEVLKWYKDVVQLKSQLDKVKGKDSDEYQNLEVDMLGVCDAVDEAADSNDFNPWPLSLMGPALLCHVCGYKIPPKLLDAFDAFIETQKIAGGGSNWLRYFEIAVKGFRSRKLDVKVVTKPTYIKDAFKMLDYAAINYLMAKAEKGINPLGVDWPKDEYNWAAKSTAALVKAFKAW